MPDWNEIRAELTKWLGYAPGEHWRDYELSVDLASDIQTDRMLLEIGMCKIVNPRHAIGFDIACAYYHRTTKRDVLDIHYGEDKVAELDWESVRDSLLAGHLDLVRDGMPVLSSSVVGGFRSVTFYRDADVVATMWAEPFVAMLDDFYVNQSDRIEEPDNS